METPLEQQIRSGLRRAADNVQPTPALYRTVRGRITAGRRRRRVFAVAVSVVAVAAAAVAIPRLAADRATPEIADVAGGATEPPSQHPPDGAATGGPGALVTLGADRLTLMDPDTGGNVEELFAFEPPAEGTNLRLAVRPGSTTRDGLTVAFTRTSEGEISVWTVRIVDGRSARPQRIGSFPDVSGPDHRGRDATPVWSPDGSHLAWTRPRAGGGSTLHVVPWSAERPSDTAGSEAGSVTVDLAADPQPDRLEADTWIAAEGSTTLWLRGSVDGQPAVYWLPIGSADGTPSTHGRLTAPQPPGVGTVDVATTPTGLIALRHDPTDGYILVDIDDAEQTPLPLPDGFAPPAAAAARISSAGDAVLLTDGTTLWRVTDRHAQRLTTDFTDAALTGR